MSFLPIENAVDEFQRGFGIVLFRIISFASTSIALDKRRFFMLLLVAILVMPICIYIVTIPVRSWLYTLEMIMSYLTLNDVSVMLKKARLSITIWSIFFETFWYLPLFVLFITRSLRLGTKPFEEVIQQRDQTFATKVFKSENKQSAPNPFVNLISKITQYAFTTTILLLVRVNPIIRLFIPISLIIYQCVNCLCHCQQFIYFCYFVFFTDDCLE